MKVVQIITSMRPAGAERILVDLCRGLPRDECRIETVSLLTLPERSSIVDGLREAGIPVHCLGVTRAAPWRMLRLYPLLRRLEPDIVHAHLFHPGLLSRFPAAAGRRYRVINTVHSADRRRWRGWQFLLDRWTWKRCDVLTAVSGAVRDYHGPLIGAPPDRIRVIYNGIPRPQAVSLPEKRDLHREWGLEGCRRVLGTAGRLDPQKGYDVLLEMLPALSPVVPPGESWGLVILGEGPMRARLEKLARAAPDNLAVRLPGFRDDAARCLGAFDLFLMPSRFEGFGLSLAEAMAQGIPVLANRVDSLPEIMETYPNGETVRFTRDNAPGVAARIRGLLLDPAELSPFAPYPVDRMVAAYLDLYRSLLAGNRPRGG